MGQLFPTLLVLAGIGSLVTGIMAAVRLPSHFRADVPRHVRREGEGSRHLFYLPLLDRYTVAGRRLQARLVGTLPWHIFLPIGLAGYGVQRGDGLSTLVGIAVVWGIIGALWFAAAWWFFVTRRGRVAPRDGEVEPAPEEFGPGQRRLCRCCGYPTIDPLDETWSCGLCDWSEDDADLPALPDARANFGRTYSAYDPARPPAWRPDGLSPDELHGRRAQVQEYDRYRRGPHRFDDARMWDRIFQLESVAPSE